MSTTYISADLRRVVAARAEWICEYCLIAEEDSYFGCAVDHIISEKHQGPTEAANLAYACVFCNQAKGSDIGSIHWTSGQFIRFYNPRTDSWAEHFHLAGDQIEGITPVAEVTARILGFNSAERVLERQILQKMLRFPRPAALRRMQPRTS